MNINLITKTRGLAFILMFIYHIFVFLNLLMNKNYLNNPFIDLIGIVARNIFIILVGVSLYLSFKNSNNIEEYKKKQLTRSIKIYCIAIYITLLTYFIIPDYYIVFGVLHFISISILLLYNFVNNFFVLILIFIICFILSNYKFIFMLPESNLFGNYINGILGLNIYKNTIDSFPLIKWLPKVIIGIFIGYILYYFYNTYNKNNQHKKNKQHKNKQHKNKQHKNKQHKNKQHKNKQHKKIHTKQTLLDIIGQNTLLLYSIHFPIIIFVIILIKRLQ
jgi:uncharacterized membrane protein